MLMKDEFVIGINYWPIDSAMSWWHRFDAGGKKLWGQASVIRY